MSNCTLDKNQQASMHECRVRIGASVTDKHNYSELKNPGCTRWSVKSLLSFKNTPKVAALLMQGIEVFESFLTLLEN